MPVAFFLIFGGCLILGQLGPREVDALPASKPTAVISYGIDALQYGELRMPPGKGPFAVVVVIHGGCWTKGFATARNTAALASDLTLKGVATWNIEYRQVGDSGGGWPGTFQDWGKAVDYVRELGRKYPLDLKRVVVAGHSAGGHAALWVAGRGRLPHGSEIGAAHPLPVVAAVSIDGPGDLADFSQVDAQICGMSVVASLMGGTPVEQPARYREGSPIALLPFGVRQDLISATVLSAASAESYRAAAAKAGDQVKVLVVDTGHFELIAPGEKPCDQVEQVILDECRVKH